MADVLSEIVAYKRDEIERTKQQVPEESLRQQLADAPKPRDFVKALQEADGIALIAEVKKASPSAGLIREDFHPVEIAKIYAAHGAACISCLTDEHFFQGHLDFLKAIRAEVTVPVMRKDFLLDRYQVTEARAAGADCVLLIAECLDDCTLRDLYFYAGELGMESLIEIYEPENLERVLKLDPPLIGINNRNLRTFVTDLKHTTSLLDKVPGETLLVSESGIRTRDDVLHLQEVGVGAMLIGETLMRPADIGAKVDEILGRDS